MEELKIEYSSNDIVYEIMTIEEAKNTVKEINKHCTGNPMGLILPKDKENIKGILIYSYPNMVFTEVKTKC